MYFYDYVIFILFFFNDTATTEIYTLSLHDALPIFARAHLARARGRLARVRVEVDGLEDGRVVGEVPEAVERVEGARAARSEEHTSEIQSRQYLVCRLLLEKKKQQYDQVT